MCTLCVVHFDPVPVRQLIRIEVVADVRVAKLVDLCIFTQSLLVQDSELIFYQRIILGESLLPDTSISNLEVETCETD